jgi:hypothetical protein
MAFVVPLLLALILGAVDLGKAYYVNLEVTNAAHAGAEYGSLHPKDTAGITAAARASEPNVSLNTPIVKWGCECSDGNFYKDLCTPVPACATSGTVGGKVLRVQVTTSASYKTLAPWPGIPSSFTLPSTATIRSLYTP